jgi:hypothetical protein
MIVFTILLVSVVGLSIFFPVSSTAGSSPLEGGRGEGGSAIFYRPPDPPPFHLKHRPLRVKGGTKEEGEDVWAEDGGHLDDFVWDEIAEAVDESGRAQAVLDRNPRLFGLSDAQQHDKNDRPVLAPAALDATVFFSNVTTRFGLPFPPRLTDGAQAAAAVKSCLADVGARSRLKGRLITLTNGKVAIVIVPKSGSSTLRSRLRSLSSSDTRPGVLAEMILNKVHPLLEGEVKGGTVITLLREPFARFVSAFGETLERCHGKAVTSDGDRRRYDALDYLYMCQNNLTVMEKARMMVERMASTGRPLNGSTYDDHFVSVAEYLLPHVAVTHVYQTEYLDEVYDEDFPALLGTVPPIQHDRFGLGECRRCMDHTENYYWLMVYVLLHAVSPTTRARFCVTQSVDFACVGSVLYHHDPVLDHICGDIDLPRAAAFMSSNKGSEVANRGAPLDIPLQSFVRRSAP